MIHVNIVMRYNSGHLVDNQGLYKAFVPTFLMREDWGNFDLKTISLLSKASQALGKLDMYSQHVNIKLYIIMHIAKEATLSSRIEGTQTQMEEVFLSANDIADGRKDDWREVLNYIEAINYSISRLNDIPFSTRLLTEIHAKLLDGVRGKHKQPGELRRSQNWIGGSNIDTATFVPPPHHLLPDLMSDIEKFAHDDSLDIPDLLKIAIIHYQFETIHPFLDGNGRLGRLMIVLYLIDKGLLQKPILYLSDYFERYRVQYFNTLTDVRHNGNLDQWLNFFLQGVIETSEKGIATFSKILESEKELDKVLSPLKGRASMAKALLNRMILRPVLSASDICDYIGKTKPTGYKLIAELEELGILTEITGRSTHRSYMYKKYIDLFR